MLNPPEPADGTRLVTEDPDGHLTIVWRDDAEARENWDHSRTPGDHWFTHQDARPIDWHDVTYDTIQIYRLVPLDSAPTSAAPPAIFSGADR